MSLKINGSNIGKIKINGNEIKLGKINNNIIFESGKYTLSYSSNTYKFTASSGGNYDIKYANGNTILNDYDSIAGFTSASGSYNSLIDLNIVPSNATKVVLVKDNDIKASINVPSDFEKVTDEPIYRVGLISDTHIDGDGTDTADSINDFKKALTLFANENVDFIAHCGDVTEDNRESDYTAYSNAVVNNTIPIKTIAGNHDSYSSLENITGNSLYYEYSTNDDIYLFLGCYQGSSSNPFSDEELSWLQTKLSTSKNKRVFLFFHYYCDPVGDANDLDNDDLGTTEQALTFRNLMNTYKDNVIYFSGHSHLTYKMQELVSNANVSLASDDMPIRVHVPSTGRPRVLNNGSITNEYVGSECAIMDVYSNYIVLKGYDLSTNKIMPIAMYKIPFEVINNEPLTSYTIAEKWVDVYNNCGAEGSLTSDNLDVWISNSTVGDEKLLMLDFTLTETHNLKATFEVTGYEGSPDYLYAIIANDDWTSVYQFTLIRNDNNASFTRTINQVLEAGNYQVSMVAYDAMDVGLKCTEFSLSTEIPENLFDLSSYDFPTTQKGLTFDYDNTKKSLSINGENNDDIMFHIPCILKPGNYTFSYTVPMGDEGFFEFSIDNLPETTLDCIDANLVTFTITQDTTELLLHFLPGWIYDNMEISFTLVKND